MKAIVFLFSISLLPSTFSYGNNDKPLVCNRDKQLQNIEPQYISFVEEGNILYQLPNDLTLSNHLAINGNDKKALFYGIIDCLKKGGPGIIWRKGCGLFTSTKSCKDVERKCRRDGGTPIYDFNF